MTGAMRQMHRLTGLLSELGFAPRAREHAVTLTASTDVLGTHYTEQLHELDEYLCESTIDGERPEDLDEQLELRAAMRHVLAQIPAEPVAA